MVGLLLQKFLDKNKDAHHRMICDHLSVHRGGGALILVDDGRGDFARLLRVGFKPEEIFPVTKTAHAMANFIGKHLTDAEILATEGHRAATMVSEAAERFAQQGHRVSAMLLDFCSSVGVETSREIWRTLGSGLITNGRVAINISVRNPGTHKNLVEWIEQQLVAVGMFKVTYVDSGRYRNHEGHTTMQWAVFDIES